MAQNANPDQIDVIIADLELYTRNEVIALALNIDANLRENPPLGTPVDTGWARNNWIPSVGSPSDIDASEKNPSAGQVSARGQIADRGRNDVLAWKPDDGSIFVTNNVPYIQPLNAGHSTQSPAGFVQVAIEKAVRDTQSLGANRAARSRRGAAYAAAKPRPKR